jgi:hypothetical protein
MRQETALKLIADGRERCGIFRLDYDPGDAWGSVMGHWFAIAGVLHTLRMEIPSEWEYRPGSEPHAADEWPDSEYMERYRQGDISADDLEDDGEAMRTYSEALKSAGLDY